jgi:hypothetical protein
MNSAVTDSAFKRAASFCASTTNGWLQIPPTSPAASGSIAPHTVRRIALNLLGESFFGRSAYLFSLTKIAQKTAPSASGVSVAQARSQPKSITVFTSKFLVVIEPHANPNQWNRRVCSYGT